jgi:hypothetical protein
VPCAIANVENAAENTKNVENKGLPLNVIVALPQEKLPVAAVRCVGAHFSCGSSAAKIRRQSGAEGQQDRPCALTLKGPGSQEMGSELWELERCGRKGKSGPKASAMVRNITNRVNVLWQCSMF